MQNSILTSTKKILGIEETYEAFDLDIITHINTVLSTLNQLGIGPLEGFMIEDKSATWDQLYGDDLRLSSIKSYVFLRVKLLFDPPQTSFHIASIEKQIQEIEWRLNVVREGDAWVNPLPPAVEDTVYDGGTP